MDETDPDLHINVPGGARAEDEPDAEGYDDAQRAEIAETEGRGQSDGTIMTDMEPDLGEADIDEDEIADDADGM
jgi:DNA-directed RNA polymerase subunit delta